MKITRFLQIAFLILLAAGAQPAYSAFWQWSKTAATNAGADPSINWAEGMSPSSINDSARAMMARAAEYRDDISGALATGGTSTAYTLTTNQGLSSPPPDGQLIAFTPHAANGVGATLSSDGGTAYPLQSSPGVAVGAATLVLGTPYTAKFSASGSAWLLRDFYGNPYAIPVGGAMPYTGSVTPNSNFIFPIGQCLSRTTYSVYFAQVGTQFGACDGTTTFAAPDFRSYAIVAADNMGGPGPGRTTLAFSQTTGVASTTIGQSQLPNVGLSVTASGSVTSTQSDILRNPSGIQTNNSGVNFGVGSGSPGGFGITSSGTFSGSTSSINGGVGQSAFSNMQPTFALNYILRVI